MALSELALTTAAVRIVRYVLDNTTGGALEEIGAKLVNFLQARLQEGFNPKQAKQEPKQLEGVILAKTLVDKDFKAELERYVTEFQNSINNSESYQQSDMSINQQNISGTAIGTNNNTGPQFFR